MAKLHTWGCSGWRGLKPAVHRFLAGGHSSIWAMVASPASRGHHLPASVPAAQRGGGAPAAGSQDRGVHMLFFPCNSSWTPCIFRALSPVGEGTGWGNVACSPDPSVAGCVICPLLALTLRRGQRAGIVMEGRAEALECRQRAPGPSSFCKKDLIRFS